MNILMLTPAYYPTQGGVETQVKLIVDTLASRGHHVSIITEMIPAHNQFEQKDNVKIFRLPASLIRLNPWKGYFFIKKNIYQIKEIVDNEKIDVIHVHHFDSSFPFVYIIKKQLSIPIISTIHVSWLADERYQQWRLNIKEPFRRVFRLWPGLWFDKKSIISADFITTVSKQLENLCKKLRNDNNVKTVFNSIDLSQFHDSVIPFEYQYNGYKILCSGRLSPEKGQIYLIRALKIIRESINAHLILIGSENGNEIKKLMAEVKYLGLQDYVHFLSPRPYSEIPSFYKGADVIVVPSTSESFGLVILENMALGKVIVASAIGGIPELIDHEKTGLLVPPADPKLLAKSIIRALTDDKLREKLTVTALEKSKLYNIDIIINELEDIYYRIVNNYGFREFR
ncbi:MAG: glycosyltransferase family 4 protein [Methanomicrobiales archaeon]|nr:glycosyltransferase family 4 protein [Methanomicrobiales archaeon]MDI6877631.1 glycosyltransferase family 4 protein [Methanomicrobiales archaeon]